MSHFHYSRTRTREHTQDYDTCFSRPPTLSKPKHQRKITLSDDSDDGHDDYPYSSSHKPPRLSRALTLRDQPSQLERYNIWSDRRDTHSDDDSASKDDRRKTYERRRLYKYSTTPLHRPHDSKDHEDQAVQLNVQAKFTRPRSSHGHLHLHHESTSVWPMDVVRRKEKWVGEDWDSGERKGRDSFWGDVETRAEEKESWSRYRRVKSMKTEEVVPLSGWRRNRIIFGS